MNNNPLKNIYSEGSLTFYGKKYSVSAKYKDVHDMIGYWGEDWVISPVYSECIVYIFYLTNNPCKIYYDKAITILSKVKMYD